MVDLMDSTKDQSNRTLEVKQGMRVEMVVNNCPQTWDIVGPGQSDHIRKIISRDAPLIQLILGMHAGESITGHFGTRDLFVEIKNISVTPKKERIW